MSGLWKALPTLLQVCSSSVVWKLLQTRTLSSSWERKILWPKSRIMCAKLPLWTFSSALLSSLGAPSNYSSIRCSPTFWAQFQTKERLCAMLQFQPSRLLWETLQTMRSNKPCLNFWLNLKLTTGDRKSPQWKLWATWRTVLPNKSPPSCPK